MVDSAHRNLSTHRVQNSGRDKAQAHLLILLLNCHNFELPVGQLVRLNEIPQSRLDKLCRALGCTMHTARQGGERMAVLRSAPKRTAPGKKRRAPN